MVKYDIKRILRTAILHNIMIPKMMIDMGAGGNELSSCQTEISKNKKVIKLLKRC